MYHLSISYMYQNVALTTIAASKSNEKHLLELQGFKAWKIMAKNQENVAKSIC
jgi:hypothetical protein